MKSYVDFRLAIVHIILLYVHYR